MSLARVPSPHNSPIAVAVTLEYLEIEEDTFLVANGHVATPNEFDHFLKLAVRAIGHGMRVEQVANPYQRERAFDARRLGGIAQEILGRHGWTRPLRPCRGDRT
jgi:hypothetical protein